MVKQKITPISVMDVSIDDFFWNPRLKINRTVTIPLEYQQLKKTGSIDAFRLDWKAGIEPVPTYYGESDVYKWVEAANYSLATNQDEKLEILLNDVIDLIGKAQQPDGYLNVYFTAVKPKRRWTDLRDCHELYCAGHLIEAAVAHFQVTGKKTLLDIACRFADYIDSIFGAQQGKKSGYDGHEEIELALIKLYQTTSEKRYLNLSKYFIEQRGQKPHYFDAEALARGEDPKAWTYWVDGYKMFQAHIPVKAQTEAVGHAVRAMYLYSALTDLSVELNDKKLFLVCRRLWKSTCTRKMYLTGGIGSTSQMEGFTFDYDLPNETAYAETCATCGLIFWNHRMLQLNCDNRYADVIEGALYNSLLSSVSLDGKRFFYVNPLASLGNHHRQEWFGCACCPPNLARLLASLGQYIYSRDETGVVVHLYIGGKCRFNIKGQNVILRQKTDYPWDGKIRFTLETENSIVFDLKLRIPGWCRNVQLRINGKLFNISQKMEKGYVRVGRLWENGDRVELNLAMPVELIRAHPDVRHNTGCVALQRGPIIYCLEEADNPVPLHRIFLPQSVVLKAQFDKNLLGGVIVIKGRAKIMNDSDWKNTLYRIKPSKTKSFTIMAIPYYAWDNRKPGQMRVWIPAWT